jgi:putative hemolysin
MIILLIEIAFILTLFIANGLFAMTEMAVVSCRKGRLQLMAERGNSGALAALALAESPSRFLPTVQTGITLVGLLAGAFGGATLAGHLASWLESFALLAAYADAISVGTVVIALTFLSLVIGELVPKRLALANPEGIASFMARPMNLLSRVTRPVIWALEHSTNFVLWLLCAKPHSKGGVSEDEVKSLMLEGSRSGVFHPAEPRMVESVLAFDQRPVVDIMTPRGKTIFLRRDENPETLWHKIVVSGHSNYPVYEGNRDIVVGIISVKSIYANSAAGISPVVGNLMVEPMFVPSKQTIASLLESFRRNGKHTAVVVDAENIFLGLVTLVDVLEAIVGELPTLEERLKPEAIKRNDGSWLVDGQFDHCKLLCLIEGLETEEFNGKIKQSIASFVSSRLRKGVCEGDVLGSSDGLHYEILDLDGERIDKVLVTRAEAKR